MVPLRFSGALPKTPIEHFLDYPVGFGQQDVYMGTPIFPEQLQPFPSKIRKARVLEALNSLGPQPFETEEPLPPDIILTKTWKKRKPSLVFLRKPRYCMCFSKISIIPARKPNRCWR